MVSTDPHAGSPASAGVFAARYRGQYPSFYVFRIAPFFFIFLAFAVLYLDDDSRRLIFSRHTAAYKPFSWLEFSFLLALVAAPLADLALSLKRVHRGVIALSVSPEGITGTVFHRTRLLTWSEIADVTVKGSFLVVRRQPQSRLDEIFAGRGLGDIRIPARHLDCEAEDVLAAARRFAPAAHRRDALPRSAAPEMS